MNKKIHPLIGYWALYTETDDFFWRGEIVGVFKKTAMIKAQTEDDDLPNLELVRIKKIAHFGPGKTPEWMLFSSKKEMLDWINRYQVRPK